MSNERLMKVLLEPHGTEKSTSVADRNNQFVFKVAVDSTKTEVKNAVEHLFEVDVEAVQICNVKGKTKRKQGAMGRQKDWKKAYVRVKAGQDINLVEGE